MDALELVWQSPEEALSLLGLTSTRVVMCMTIAPILTPAQTPWVMRAGVAASLVLPMILPSLHGGQWINHSAYWAFALTFKEAVVGMFLGLILGMPVWIAEGFGILFDNERGAMTGGTFNPLIASPSPIGALLQYFAILALLSTSSGDALLEALASSFAYWQPDQFLPSHRLMDAASIIDLFNDMAKLMLLYFLPMLAMLMLLEFGLALISVYAPSLQAFQMAMPVKSYAGLVMLLAALGLFWAKWQEHTWEYLDNVRAMMIGLR
jgi:type III secretion protein T